MLSAKQIVKKHLYNYKGPIEWHAAIYDVVTEAVKEYAADACKEQRALCATNFQNAATSANDMEAIYNAPQPELL